MPCLAFIYSRLGPEFEQHFRQILQEFRKEFRKIGKIIYFLMNNDVLNLILSYFLFILIS